MSGTFTSTDDSSPQPEGLGFPVVGIGASAGGLDALRRFVSAVQSDPGVAFVIVTHQQAGQVSLVPELLASETSLPVVAVHDGTVLAPSTIFVASGRVVLDANLLRLEDERAGTRHHPIDAFLCSLAVLREHAIAVILSGTGNDGAKGAQQISAAGGLVLVQDPESARFGEMPSSVAQSCPVNAILPPGSMPKRIEELMHARRSGERPPHEDVTAALFRVLHLLRARTGQDFTAYKKSTLWRRIERRMNGHGVTSPQEYARILESKPEEIEVLFKELLISVTSFFRDPDTLPP